MFILFKTSLGKECLTSTRAFQCKNVLKKSEKTLNVTEVWFDVPREKNQ